MQDQQYHNSTHDGYRILAVSLSIAFSAIFSYYSILRYLSGDATGFDLGIYASALYNAIHGGLFYTNLLGGSFLGNHFSPFMFILVPFFYLYPHNATILVLQGFALGMTGVPAYLVFESNAKSQEQKAIAILFLILLEVSPILIGPISFDFHLMVFFPVFYLTAFYYLLKGNVYKAAVFIVLSVSLHAFFSVIVAFLFISIYLQGVWSRRHGSTIFSRALSARSLIAFLIMLGIYLILAEHVKGIISGQSIDLVNLHSLLAFIKLRYNIVFSIASLEQSLQMKLLMVMFIVIGGLIFAIRYPILLLPLVPYIVFAFFSGNTAYFTVGYQYTAMFIPIILAGASLALSDMLSKSVSKGRRFNSMRYGIAMILVLLIILNFIYSPVSPEPIHISAGNITSISSFDRNSTSVAIFAVRSYLNHSSYILLQNDVYPPFFQFRNAYLLYSYNLIGNLNDLLRQNFTYVIGDEYNTFYYQTAAVGISMQSLIEYDLMHGYGILFDEYGIIVIERGYVGPELHLQGNRIVS
ncbi:DUF2079 domain-containing protein [Thermoplasma sp.]|uniref:DUF2079 domain-containing protein n=1 Tax=Thermoplasma sp. TaxID=1973142 RepID=UPI00127FF6D6|nr:DUF2079 domain-containing protein [Thermoplasma sp.]KAA8922714.1 MAG: DUF2079 domain-containing protein [Thermoplasma sp.]